MNAFLQKILSEKKNLNQYNNELCFGICDAFFLYEEVHLEEKVQ